jgi:hypothetical protein
VAVTSPVSCFCPYSAVEHTLEAPAASTASTSFLQAFGLALRYEKLKSFRTR